MSYIPAQDRPAEPQETGLPASKQFDFRSFVANFKYPLLPGRPLSKALGSQTIGTIQIAIPHKLGKVPNVIIVQMTSAGQIWQSQAADGMNIYLKADAAGRTGNIHVLNIQDSLR